MTSAVRFREIPVRWVMYENGEKIGEGTTVASTTVLNGVARQYEAKGRKFMWERIRCRAYENSRCAAAKENRSA